MNQSKDHEAPSFGFIASGGGAEELAGCCELRLIANKRKLARPKDVASIQSMERLKELATKHGVELFFSHDPESWPDYVKAPAFYS